MAERSFVLSVPDGAERRRIPVYTSPSIKNLNFVKMQREEYTKIELVLKRSDARDLFSRVTVGVGVNVRTLEDIELIIRDDIITPTPTEIKLSRITPHSIRHLDENVCVAEFRHSDTENIYGNWVRPDEYAVTTFAEFSTNGQMAINGLQQSSVSQNRWEFNGEMSLAGLPFFGSTPQEVIDAAAVGNHYFVRPESVVGYLRAISAICGVRSICGATSLGYPQWRYVFADADQPDLAAMKPAKYLIAESPNIPRTMHGLYLWRMYFRNRIDSRKFFISPSRTSVISGAPAFYFPSHPDNPAGTPAQYSNKWFPLDHLSTLIYPIYGGTLYSEAVIHKETHERATKAAERTVRGYNRCSRRSDWYTLAGFHPITLGSEIDCVTYQNQKTMVDFRDTRQPGWPQIPPIPHNVVEHAIAQITASLGGGEYAATLSSAHSAITGWTATPVIVEDKLSLFPMLAAGDQALIAWDGIRGIVLNTQASYDLGLP